MDPNVIITLFSQLTSPELAQQAGTSLSQLQAEHPVPFFFVLTTIAFNTSLNINTRIIAFSSICNMFKMIPIGVISDAIPELYQSALSIVNSQIDNRLRQLAAVVLSYIVEAFPHKFSEISNILDDPLSPKEGIFEIFLIILEGGDCMERFPNGEAIFAKFMIGGINGLSSADPSFRLTCVRILKNGFVELRDLIRSLVGSNLVGFLDVLKTVIENSDEMTAIEVIYLFIEIYETWSDAFPIYINVFCGLLKVGVNSSSENVRIACLSVLMDLLLVIDLKESVILFTTFSDDILTNLWNFPPEEVEPEVVPIKTSAILASELFVSYYDKNQSLITDFISANINSLLDDSLWTKNHAAVILLSIVVAEQKIVLYINSRFQKLISFLNSPIARLRDSTFYFMACLFTSENTIFLRRVCQSHFDAILKSMNPNDNISTVLFQLSILKILIQSSFGENRNLYCLGKEYAIQACNRAVSEANFHLYKVASSVFHAVSKCQSIAQEIYDRSLSIINTPGVPPLILAYEISTMAVCSFRLDSNISQQVISQILSMMSSDDETVASYAFTSMNLIIRRSKNILTDDLKVTLFELSAKVPNWMSTDLFITIHRISNCDAFVRQQYAYYMNSIQSAPENERGYIFSKIGALCESHQISIQEVMDNYGLVVEIINQDSKMPISDGDLLQENSLLYLDIAGVIEFFTGFIKRYHEITDDLYKNQRRSMILLPILKTVSLIFIKRRENVDVDLLKKYFAFLDMSSSIINHSDVLIFHNLSTGRLLIFWSEQDLESYPIHKAARNLLAKIRLL